MPRKPINFNLDFMVKDIFPRFTVKQFDDVSFNIKPLIQGKDYDVTGMKAKIYVGVANDMFLQSEGITVSKDNINVILDKNMLQKKGRAFAEIELEDSAGTITSSSFIFDIDAKIGEGATIPGGIDGFVAKYEKLVSEFKKQVDDSVAGIDGKLDGVVEGIQEDYEGLRKVIIDENVSVNLQNQINQTKSQLETNANNTMVYIHQFPRENNETDDTNRIQRMFDYCKLNNLSNAKISDGVYTVKAKTDHNDFPTIGGILIHSNINIIIENATIEAITENSTRYCIFRLDGCENVKITGLSATLNGKRNTVTDNNGEWGHGIMIIGCNNIVIDGLEIKDCYGDGVFIGAKNYGTYPSDIKESSNIKIRNNKIDNNRRQGISVVACDGCDIMYNNINNTNGKPPQCGIDIEWNGYEVTKNINIYNNCFDNNKAKAILNMSGKNVNIYNNTLVNCVEGGISCFNENDNAVIGCNIYDNTIIQNSIPSGVDNYGIFASKTSDILIKNNTIKNFVKSGIYVGKSNTKSFVKMNNIIGCKNGVSFQNDIEISNNTISNSTINSIVSYLPSVTDVTIKNNIFNDNNIQVINIITNGLSLMLSNNTFNIENTNDNLIFLRKINNSIISNNNINIKNINDITKKAIILAPESVSNLVSNNSIVVQGSSKFNYSIGESKSSGCSNNSYLFNSLKNTMSNSSLDLESTSTSMYNVI